MRKRSIATVLLLMVLPVRAAAGGGTDDPLHELEEIEFTLRQTEEALQQSLTEQWIGNSLKERDAAGIAEELTREFSDEDGELCLGHDPCSESCRSEENQKRRALMAAVCQIGKLQDIVREELSGRGKLSGSIQIGASGDETDERDLLKISTGLDLSAGSYPNEFRANWEAQVRFEDGEIDEDVTTATIKFDHYFKDWLEGFAFVERFTDSFMSIDQRYEAGFGAEFELKTPFGSWWDKAKEDKPEGLTGDGVDKLSSWKELQKLGLLTVNEDALTLEEKQLQDRLDGLDGLPPSLSKDYVETVKALVELAEEKKVRNGIRRRHAKFEAGLSLALLTEAERFELTTRLVDAITLLPVGPASETIDGSRTITRISVRPSVRIRLKDDLQIRAMAYYKRSLEGEGPGDETDYRIDGLLSMELGLGKTIFGAEASARVAYEYHYDNAPPTVAETGVVAPAGQVYLPALAEDSHEVYKLNLRLKW